MKGLVLGLGLLAVGVGVFGVSKEVRGQNQQYTQSKDWYATMQDNKSKIREQVKENIRNPEFLRRFCSLFDGELKGEDLLYALTALVQIDSLIDAFNPDSKEFGMLWSKINDDECKQKILEEVKRKAREEITPWSAIEVKIYCKFLELKRQGYSDEKAAEEIANNIKKGLMP